MPHKETKQKIKIRMQGPRKNHMEQITDNDIKSTQFNLWTPSGFVAFKLLLSARLCSAIWSNISDCDETFNYWEPLHFLMFGNGFQTWEYSPVYSLRSYGYIWIHLLPIMFYNVLLRTTHKILHFYFLRCGLGFFSCLGDAFLYKSVCKEFGGNTCRLLLLFQIFSPGMFISSTAFLPSSFSMYMTTISIAAWFQGFYQASIFLVAASAIIGWPFAAITGIPIFVDIVIIKRKFNFFIQWFLITGFVCMMPLILIDSYYYGKWVIAPLNIVLYNVFTDHGPDLYGTEPWSFYFINGFLNFNIVFLIAIFSLPIIIVAQNLLKISIGRNVSDTCKWPIPLILLPFYLWIIVFIIQPHKEERFLFPIYSLICLSAAIAIDHFQRIICWFSIVASQIAQKGLHYSQYMLSKIFVWIVIMVYVSMSISRIVSICINYQAPLNLYGDLTKIAENPNIHRLPPDAKINICVGKEWYRFPSSFFLPDNWRLMFIKSEFKGQLPQYYIEGNNATFRIPKNMNSQNLEEVSRYINITKCHYLIDLDNPITTLLEPNYSQDSKNWKIILSSSFLLSSESSSFYRSFYIPFLSYKNTAFANYNLLQTKRLKKHIKTFKHN